MKDVSNPTVEGSKSKKQMLYDGQKLQNMNLQLLYPLLYFFPDGLICIHDRLLVNDDLGCVRLGSTNPRGNCCRIGFHDDAIEICSVSIYVRRPRWRIYPSSIVSSKHRRTISRFSRTARFST